MQLSLHTTRFDQDIIILEELPVRERVAFKKYLLNNHLQTHYDKGQYEAVEFSTYISWCQETAQNRQGNK